MSFLVEYNPVVEYELNGKLESEARESQCRVYPGHMGTANGSGYIVASCVASQCNHWRWLHKGATRYEKQTFDSEFPVPNGNRDTAPADVPDGWTFIAWDANVKKDTAKPRFWAKRACEIILPRGLCGLAGEE